MSSSPSSDVIHSWTIPSFGSKVDAVPGRITATWFKATKEGIYFGQCSELCGKDHAFMPIAIRVVKDPVFADWAKAVKDRNRRPRQGDHSPGGEGARGPEQDRIAITAESAPERGPQHATLERTRR